MTKTEARAYIKRIREDLRDAEWALKNNNAQQLLSSVHDASGCAAEIETALCDDYIGTGVAGMRVN
jgi:hypothetical protein